MKAWAAVLFAVAWAAHADPIIKPLAKCANGVCTMTQKDYDDLVAFHQAVFLGVAAQQAQIAALEERLADRERQLLRYGGGCKGSRT